MRDWRQFFTERDCEFVGGTGSQLQSQLSMDRANAIIRDFVEKERTLLFGNLTEQVPSHTWSRSPMGAGRDTHQASLLFPEERTDEVTNKKIN